MSLEEGRGTVSGSAKGPPGTVSGRTVREGRVRRRRERATGTRGGLRVLLFLLVLGAVVVVGSVTVLAPVTTRVARGLAESNPAMLRLPFVADVVRDQLGDDLTQPAGGDATPVRFTVQSQTSAQQVGEELEAQGLVRNKLAFQYWVVRNDVGNQIQAGTYLLNRGMTPLQIIDLLREGPKRDRTIAIQLREGLRLEQVTAYLQTLGFEADMRQFNELALKPPATLRADFKMLVTLPKGRSLEGYLGSGTIDVPPSASPEEILRALLKRREEEISESIAAAKEQGKDFYRTLILASIVEREVAVDAERPLVAGVYQNRLDRGSSLNADPTVFYAYDTLQLRKLDMTEWTAYAFWTPVGKALSSIALSPDLQGFQTYQEPGLVPWPICSPSVASLEAALKPNVKTGYLYFVSKNDGTHEHAFAKTLAEHQGNVRKYHKP